MFVLDVRKGHYIVAEYVDKVTNKHCPNHPWQVRFPSAFPYPSSNLSLCPCSTRYALPPFKPIESLIIIPLKFAESQVAPKAKLPQIIQAVISSLASPESEMTANTLVLVAHGISGDLRRLEEMKISELADVPSICFAFLFLFPFPFLSTSLSLHFRFLFLYSPLPVPLSFLFLCLFLYSPFPFPSRPPSVLFLPVFVLFFSYPFALPNSIPSTFPL